MYKVFLRGLAYLVLGVLLAEVLRLEALALDPNAIRDTLFLETGYAELLQTTMLALAVALLAIKAMRDEADRQLTVCMMLTFLVLLIRENDHMLDRVLFHGSWKWLVLGPFILCVAYFWKHRRRIETQLVRYAGTASFGVMASGLAVLAFSRLFGRTSFWMTVMGESYARAAKNAAEEGVELIALGLLLMAVLEFAVFAPRRAAEPDSSAVE